MRRDEYPNPDAVVYAAPLPPRFPCQQTTQDPGKLYPVHNHGAWMDRQGNGTTDVDSGHYHRVRRFKVVQDQSDGHTHQLTMLPCGAGAAQTVGRDGAIATIPSPSAAGGYNGTMLAAPEPFHIRPWMVVVGAVVVLGAVVGAVIYFNREQES